MMKHENTGDLGHVLSADELDSREDIVVPEGATVLTRDEVRHAVRQRAAQIALAEFSEHISFPENDV